MLNFGKVSFNDFANSTAVYKNAGYQTYYNFVTQDLQTFYTSDSQEFLVADENSYSPNAIVEITAPSDAEIINFYTPAVFNKDDVYKVNGVVAQVVNLNGEKVLSGWSAGVPITLIYKDNKLFYDIGSGAPAVPTNTLFLDGETVKFDSMSLDVTNPVRTMSVKAKPFASIANGSDSKQFAVTKNGHVFMISAPGSVAEYNQFGEFIKNTEVTVADDEFSKVVSDGEDTLYILSVRAVLYKYNTVTGEVVEGQKNRARAPSASDPDIYGDLSYDNGFVYIYPENLRSGATRIWYEKVDVSNMTVVEKKEFKRGTPEVSVDPIYTLIELTGESSAFIAATFCKCAYFDGKIYAIIDSASNSDSAVPLPDVSGVSKFYVSSWYGWLMVDIFGLHGLYRYKIEGGDQIVAQLSFDSLPTTMFNADIEKIGDIIYLSDMVGSLQSRAPSAISNDSYMTISAYAYGGQNTGVVGEQGYIKIGEIPITVGENTFVYSTMSSSGNTLFLYEARKRNSTDGSSAPEDSFIGYIIPYRLNNSDTEHEIYKDLKYSNKTIIKNGITSAKAGNTVEFSLDKSFFQVNHVEPVIVTISGKGVDFTTKVSGNAATNGEYSFVMPSEDVVISKETYAGGSN